MLTIFMAAAAMGSPHGMRPVAAIEPARWIDTSDYPGGRLLRGDELGEGQVYFVLKVDVSGKPYGCDYQTSSKEQELGRRSCSLLLERAMFTPAADDQGKPVAGTYASVVNWVVTSRYTRMKVPDLVLDLRHYPDGVDIRTRAIASILVEKDGTISLCTAQRASLPLAIHNILCDQVVHNWHPQPLRNASGELVRSVQRVTIGFELAS